MKTADHSRNEVVSLLDLSPTLLATCELPPAPKAEGQSLLPLLSDPNADRAEPVLTS